MRKRRTPANRGRLSCGLTLSRSRCAQIATDSPRSCRPCQASRPPLCSEGCTQHPPCPLLLFVTLPPPKNEAFEPFDRLTPAPALPVTLKLPTKLPTEFSSRCTRHGTCAHAQREWPQRVRKPKERHDTLHPGQELPCASTTQARRRNHRTQPSHSRANQSNAPPPPDDGALPPDGGGLPPDDGALPGLMVTSSCACGPSTAPLVGLVMSTVNDFGDPTMLAVTMGMTAVWDPESPSAQDKVSGVAVKSALVADPATGVSVTEIGPVE